MKFVKRVTISAIFASTGPQAGRQAAEGIPGTGMWFNALR